MKYNLLSNLAGLILVILFSSSCQKDAVKTNDLLDRTVLQAKGGGGGPKGGFSYVDVDGNSYGTVQLGDQLWMTENLRVSRLNDGTAIAKKQNSEIGEYVGSAYTYYNNDSSFQFPNGKLYNRYAVVSGKLCPTDWHVASEDDFIELGNFIDSINDNQDDNDDAHLLKSTKGWLRSANVPRSSNKTGFTAYPSGFVNFAGSSLNATTGAYFWTSTEYVASGVNSYYQLRHDVNDLDFTQNGSNQSFSVRCVKD